MRAKGCTRGIERVHIHFRSVPVSFLPLVQFGEVHSGSDRTQMLLAESETLSEQRFGEEVLSFREL